MTDAWRAPEASQRYVLDTVRRADRDRFLGALFAPEPARTRFVGILAFDHELARTRSVTREPMLARIRLEWWREAVAEAAGSGKPRAQPIVESLSETVRRRGLAPERLLALIDAREEEIEGPLDVLRAGHALADLQLAVLGIDDAPTTQAARAVAAAWLMGGARARRAARRGARAASRGRSGGAAHPAAGALARRHGAWRSRSPIGGRRGAAILTHVPRIDKSWVVSRASRTPSTTVRRPVPAARRQLRFEAFRRDVEDAGLDGGCVPFGAAYASKEAPGAPSAVSGWRSAEGPIGGGNVARAKANGIEIEYETAGNKSDPALLLVMGLGAQLTIWPDALFQGLAQAGLLRHPLRQPRHRPVDRLRRLGRAQHRRWRSRS